MCKRHHNKTDNLKVASKDRVQLQAFILFAVEMLRYHFHFLHCSDKNNDMLVIVMPDAISETCILKTYSINIPVAVAPL